MKEDWGFELIYLEGIRLQLLKHALPRLGPFLMGLVAWLSKLYSHYLDGVFIKNDTVFGLILKFI